MTILPTSLRTTLLALGISLSIPAIAGSILDSSGRVIVQLRADSVLASRQVSEGERRSILSARMGLPLESSSGPAPGTLVLRAEGLDAESLAARLAADPDVMIAEPNRRKSIRRAPNDPLYAEQWLMGVEHISSINAEAAWDITTGSNEVVVAVVDSGVRYGHEDLPNLLPGYDFISDPMIANDGDGRDNDASDPGDYLSATDLQNPSFSGCGGGPFGDRPTSSSWHGTRVAGVVAAAGNNSRGVAGVNWQARILPVRALGKCGGFDIDILAAMRWAGGLEVPGAPTNPTPAKVINLSLGGTGTCSDLYRQTVEELRARGVAVVAAAGNSIEVEVPGNCPGVITVAGIRHVGTKVGYSSIGPEVDVAAPAGNCGDAGTPECLYQIPTTTNLGSTSPGQNGYSDQLHPTYGTSFATPLGAGVAALMLSAHPGLLPDAIGERIRASARPFPSGDGLVQCPTLDPASDYQCACTTTTCGAGMLDAAGAVREALRPQAVVVPTGAGTSVMLDGAASTARNGGRLVAWQWSQLQGPSSGAFDAPHAASTRFQAALAGDYRLALMVEDEGGGRDTREFVVSLSGSAVAPDPDPAPEPTTPDPDSTAAPKSGGGGGAADPASMVGLLALAAIAYRLRRRRRDA